MRGKALTVRRAVLAAIFLVAALPLPGLIAAATFSAASARAEIDGLPSETREYRAIARTYASVPRGCATSWSSLYLAQLDAGVASDQYARERDALRKDVLGVGGFREWPEGRGGGADVDSGPIVLGVGVAASALGLGPARLFGDAAAYASIRRAALVFGVPAWWPSGGYLTAPILGEAILFDGRTARPWFGAVPQLPERPASVPVGAWVVVIVDLVALGWIGRGIARG